MQSQEPAHDSWPRADPHRARALNANTLGPNPKKEIFAFIAKRVLQWARRVPTRPKDASFLPLQPPYSMLLEKTQATESTNSWLYAVYMHLEPKGPSKEPHPPAPGIS